ncbi:type II toxin-antitoxin system HicB family antitoxin [Thermomicrobium sp. CFH 73360]|uniref:type II toxin-antitoxin system HicB family antitoxin n=1 Tax=Thermomicrobium sp. CFH 73360 TaxID=2951987 RepID=UPI002076DCAF|nr:type II toxin-antitoxin system HicB family antitoxin [Thermomicrobium sp. CFH 73360]MCM8746319.1 type II toxin-antitoxin system HicB family antitoxin [Thermomicrobium sp. CFH 73360]
MIVAHWRLVAERWESTWLGFIIELPGCLITGCSLEELITEAPMAIAKHRTWLCAKGLTVAECPTNAITVVEVAEASPDGRRPLFEIDQRVITPEELAHALEVGDAALNELVALTDRTREWETLPLDHRPSGCTPPQIVRHVAEFDRWYAARLAPDAGALALPEDPLLALRQAAQAFVSVTRAWWAVWGSRVVERDGEQWTVAKVLRRRTSHLCKHAIELLAWVQCMERARET